MTSRQSTSAREHWCDLSCDIPYLQMDFGDTNIRGNAWNENTTLLYKEPATRLLWKLDPSSDVASFLVETKTW